jgi:phosphoribosylformylglycinamidine cyclo-ligase
VVAKDKIITGKDIIVGDMMIGLPSNGLHTNGYSLARKVLGETRAKLNVRSRELGTTIGEALLRPHLSYYRQLQPLLPSIKGLAHITGGGIVGNVPRILPEGLAVQLDSKQWAVPPIFTLIQKKGKIDLREMYQTFNMGIGMVVICAPEKVRHIVKAVSGAKVVGEVVKQKGRARVIINNRGYRKDKVA